MSLIQDCVTQSFCVDTCLILPAGLKILFTGHMTKQGLKVDKFIYLVILTTHSFMCFCIQTHSLCSSLSVGRCFNSLWRRWDLRHVNQGPWTLSDHQRTLQWKSAAFVKVSRSQMTWKTSCASLSVRHLSLSWFSTPTEFIVVLEEAAFL